MLVSVDAEQNVVGHRRRRRVRSVEEKLRLVGLTYDPSTSVAEVAQRHGVNANLLFTWRRQLSPQRIAAALAESGPPQSFAIVDVIAAAPAEPGQSFGGVIEIELPGGARVRVDAQVDQTALVRVLSALKAVS